MTKKPELIPASCGICTYFKRSGVVQGTCRFYNVRRYAGSACLAEREDQPGVAAEHQPADVSQAQPLAGNRDVEKPRPSGEIEVETADGQDLFFPDYECLREAIQAGRVGKDDKARVTVAFGDSPQQPPWSTVQKVAAGDFGTYCLYEPVSAHTYHGFGIGAVIGFLAGVVLAICWAVIALLTAWSAAGRAPRLDLSASELLALLTQFCQTAWAFVLAGASFAALAGPSGAIIGTFVGLVRRPSLPKAPNATPEAVASRIRGVALAAVWLALWTPVSFLWLNPKVLRWVTNDVFPIVEAIFWPK